jgi:hypothetical protein
MTVLATGQRTSTIACVVESVVKYVREVATRRGVQVPGTLSTDIRWVGSPVMPCPGVLVSAMGMSPSDATIPGCVTMPQIRVIAQIGRGCQIAFAEDGTTNPQAALGTTLLASDDAEILWEVANALSISSPSVSFETNGGMLITSVEFTTTEMDLTKAGVSC